MSILAKKNTDLREGDQVMALIGGGGYAGMTHLAYSKTSKYNYS